MSPSVALLFLLSLMVFRSGCVTTLKCQQVPGALVQIDAGNGQVFGVNAGGEIYTLYSGGWAQVPGGLIHVTVGTAGVWGVNKNNNIFKMVGGDWVEMYGLLKQVDAGGAEFISGANSEDKIFCLGEDATISAKDASGLPFVNIDGKLKYYTCGHLGCWGVNSGDVIFYRSSVTSKACAGSSWKDVPGSLSMIEVGSEGSVYGVNSVGDLYRRDGITAENPVGTGWTQLIFNSEKFRHVSEDLGQIWALTIDQRILKCHV